MLVIQRLHLLERMAYNRAFSSLSVIKLHATNDLASFWDVWHLCGAALDAQ
jgi:hypothetical protein